MVYVNNKKFACESCIKGHRSSSCSHADRPLFEVKKKGRPISQCERCRQLRKSRKVHSKCTCNDPKPASSSQTQPEEAASSAGTKSNRRFVPSEPTYPNGLRDIFQTSKASIPADVRQRVETLLNPCSCNTKNASDCRCAKPSQLEMRPHDSLDFVRDEPRLIMSSRAAASCCSAATPPDSELNSANNQAESSKRHPSRPATPPGPTHKRLKSTVSTSPPTLELPPIIPSSLPLPSAIPDFGIIPPLRTVASLAGSGCTCGWLCACPGCDEHNGQRNLPSTSSDCCGKACNQCVDPSLATSLPGASGFSSGSSIIDKFFARAAALPSPPSTRKVGGVTINPMDTTIYPSTVRESEEHRAAFGLVNVPKLECCGGNCGCPYGRCGCGQACNGCCSDHSNPTIEAAPREEQDSGTLPPPHQSPIVHSCCGGSV